MYTLLPVATVESVSFILLKDMNFEEQTSISKSSGHRARQQACFRPSAHLAKCAFVDFTAVQPVLVSNSSTRVYCLVPSFKSYADLFLS